MKIEQDIASEEYEDLLARVESLEKSVKDIHIGGDLAVGNLHALGLITGIFRAGTGIKDDDLDGFQMDGDEFVGQASGADKVSISASTGLITIGAGNAIDGSSIDALSIVAGSITANTITANKFNLALHYVDGTFTDDSPSAGYVAWASCTVTYNGTTHTITAGNSNSAIIWWDLSSPTAFQTAASYPTLDTTDDIIIGWNTSGTFVPLWQTRSVHGENIVASTITTDEIAANTIVAGDIASGTITSTEIATGTVVVGDLHADTQAQLFDSAAASDNVQAWAHASDVTLIDGGDVYANSVTVAKFNSDATDRMFDSSAASDNVQGWPHASDVTKIDGGDIYTNSITATQISVASLSALNADLGTITAGSINMFTGTWDSNATGFRLTADEICGQLAGTDQILLAASTGKLTAGAGAVTLDADGIRLDADDAGWLRWLDNSDVMGQIRASHTATPKSGTLVMRGLGANETGNKGVARMEGYNYAESEYAYVQASSNAGITLDPSNAAVTAITIAGAQTLLRFVDANTEIWEDASSNLSLKDANAGTLTLAQLSNKKIVMQAPTELTISGGAITVTGSYHEVDTEGDAASDNLDTINGGVDGMRLVLKQVDAARDVTVRDHIDNINLDGNVDFTLTNIRRRIELMYDGTAGDWNELGRSSN